MLENILYWDTCSERYKEVIKKYLKEQESPKEKALEFGDWAELLYTIDSDYCEGAKVLVCDTMITEGYVSVIVNGRSEKSVHVKYLKPL